MERRAFLRRMAGVAAGAGIASGVASGLADLTTGAVRSEGTDEIEVIEGRVRGVEASMRGDVGAVRVRVATGDGDRFVYFLDGAYGDRAGPNFDLDRITGKIRAGRTIRVAVYRDESRLEAVKLLAP